MNKSVLRDAWEGLFSSALRVLFWAVQAVRWHLHTTMRIPIAQFAIGTATILRALGFQATGTRLGLKGRRIAVLSKADPWLIRVATQNPPPTFVTIATTPIDRFSRRVLILKLPRLRGEEVIEKGVIVVKFTEVFLPVLFGLDVAALTRYFRLVLEPSWAGYSTPEILAWTSVDDKVVVMAPYERDFNLLRSLRSNLVPTRLGAGDWVAASTSRERHASPCFDVIYVANFNAIKRVDRFLRATVNVAQVHSDYRAALVCSSHGGDHSALLETIRWAQRRARLAYFQDLSYRELQEVFGLAKVHVLLSAREGASKVLSEGLFADVPALLLEENVGVNRAHINSCTGRVVPDRGLEEALLWFRDHYREFRPREWAINNISAEVSTKVLSSELRSIELAENRVWTHDLAVKTNRPELTYVHPSNEVLLPIRDRMLAVFSRGGSKDEVSTFVKSLERVSTSTGLNSGSTRRELTGAVHR